MKTEIVLTIEPEDLERARDMALARGLVVRGGKIGPEPRGNVAALVRHLIREESDRTIADRVEQDRRDRAAQGV